MKIGIKNWKAKSGGYIYSIKNKINGKLYIGQTIQNVRLRVSAHFRLKGNSPILKQDILEFGKEYFEMQEIFYVFDRTYLDEYEKFFISKYKTKYPHGYNKHAGGAGIPIFTKKTRKIMSAKKKGKAHHTTKHSRESILKMMQTKGVQPILATCLTTNKSTWYLTNREPALYGRFDYRLVNACCLGKRKRHLNHTFEYANQSGSTEIKNSGHAQRIEIENRVKKI